jgi:DUF1016 N-terminal domain
VAVNQELILALLGIGREILERQAREDWRSRVIDRLSADLRRDFPDMTGLSARNLKYMRALAEARGRSRIREPLTETSHARNIGCSYNDIMRHELRA